MKLALRMLLRQLAPFQGYHGSPRPHRSLTTAIANQAKRTVPWLPWQLAPYQRIDLFSMATLAILHPKARSTRRCNGNSHQPSHCTLWLPWHFTNSKARQSARVRWQPAHHQHTHHQGKMQLSMVAMAIMATRSWILELSGLLSPRTSVRRVGSEWWTYVPCTTSHDRVCETTASSVCMRLLRMPSRRSSFSACGNLKRSSTWKKGGLRGAKKVGRWLEGGDNLGS